MDPQAFANFLQSDPGVQQYLKSGAWKQAPGTFPDLKASVGLASYLKTRGIAIPDGYHVTTDGQLQKNPPGWQTALGIGASLAGPLAVGLSGAGAAAGTSGTVASDTTGPTLAQLGATSGQTAALTGGTAAATSSSLWDKILSPGVLGPIIAGGTGLAGAAIQANANNNATAAQAKAAEDALNFEKQMYAQQRADLANYRGAGQGAVGQLSYALGVPGFESGPMAPQQQYNLSNPSNGQFSNAQPANQLTPTSALPPWVSGGVVYNRPNGPGSGNLASLNAPTAPTASSSTADMVTVKAPTGEVRQIPASQLARAIGLGAVQV